MSSVTAGELTESQLIGLVWLIVGCVLLAIAAALKARL